MTFSKFKKTISAVMLAVFIVTTFSINAFADITEYEGKCGENVRYSFNESTGELMISGEGEMYNYSSEWEMHGYLATHLLPWKEYKSDIKSIIIDNGVTSIGDGAFSGCLNLTSVTISNSVLEIGANAFWGCERLKFIEIPNSVTSIGSSAFGWCEGLISITIPHNVTKISDSTFFSCRNLRSVKIMGDVTQIGEMAFKYCTSLVFINIPKSLISDGKLSIGKEAFSGCPCLEIPPLSIIYHQMHYY